MLYSAIHLTNFVIPLEMRNHCESRSFLLELSDYEKKRNSNNDHLWRLFYSLVLPIHFSCPLTFSFISILNTIQIYVFRFYIESFRELYACTTYVILQYYEKFVFPLFFHFHNFFEFISKVKQTFRQKNHSIMLTFSCYHFYCRFVQMAIQV